MKLTKKLPIQPGLFCSVLLLPAFIPREKVYLHLDKPYYAPGNTTCFKGYVTVGSRHQNITTNQNRKANVTFYTPDIKGVYTIKISGVDATGGIGDGSFKLNQSKHEIP